MRRRLPFFAAALAAALLGACSSTPSSSFYTLQPDATLTPEGAAAPVTVVVGPVTIPELVDRPQFVTRLGDNQVSLNEFSRWAEPLRGDIQRVIAADLAELLGTDRVNVYDTTSAGQSVWRVRVDVMQFDSALGQAATVEALWTITPPKKGTPVLGHTLAHEAVAGQGYDALVVAHDRALAAVSRDIAAAIRANLAQ